VADPATKRGFGLALGWWSTGIAAGSAATVALTDDGIATIHTGATEIGTGAVVSGIALLAADELGLDVARIRLVSGSTDEPYDVGSEGSRTMYGAGVAVQRAAAEVSAILARAIGVHLEADPADIVLRDGRIMVAGSPERSVSIVEAVRLASAGGPVIGAGRFFAPTAEHDPACLTGMFLGSNNEPTFHCHGVEILVNEETGDIRIPRYIAAHDIGRAVNPVGIRGQIEGGVVQGIGYALYEEVQTTADGHTLNDNLADYRMPTAADIPDALEIHLVEGHEALAGPHGAKGVGEAPALLPPAALGSAIRDAIGAQPSELPMNGPRILDCLDACTKLEPTRPEETKGSSS
jgi:CO/xanthine dehydrogenase Mo-binding subunit